VIQRHSTIYVTVSQGPKLEIGLKVKIELGRIFLKVDFRFFKSSNVYDDFVFPKRQAIDGVCAIRGTFCLVNNSAGDALGFDGRSGHALIFIEDFPSDLPGISLSERQDDAAEWEQPPGDPPYALPRGHATILT
jgi:hypothetical protein